ncbi:MAG: putative inorganic carbon transporter subunit DabA, partial [Gemmatimonadaceae bacterium]
MNLALGRRLKIRAIVHVAGEPIPYFWPMRTFIHHNPLYGLEHLPFDQAVAMGARLFRARGYLPRVLQQRQLAAGKVDRAVLEDQVAHFLAGQPAIAGLDLERLLMTLLTEIETPIGAPPALAHAGDIHAVLAGHALPPREIGGAALAAQVGADMPPGRPLYAIVDMLFGTEIGATLDELVIKSCLDFFDEGQSVWQMPGREKGLFAAWSAVARRNLRLFIRGLHIKRILAVDDTPEGIISHVMGELGVPEDDWMNHFTCELTRLHGWAGFIRWRAGAKHYHWARHYPADLVDYLAIRLVLGLALLREHAERKGTPANLADLARFVESHPAEAYLRREFHGGHVLPEMAHAVEDAIAARRPARIARLLPQYLARKREHEARCHAAALHRLATCAGMADALPRLAPDDVARLTATLARFEQEEGGMWLGALEAHYMGRLLHGLDLALPAPREKRPFAQVMFCIDVRSERIRRHLEKVGDYQTFGIAGFFGVPVSFIGLEKG